MLRFLGALVAALMLVTAAPTVALADPLDDLASELGIRPEPTDFVILVDTSQSMQQDGRWGRLRQALGSMAGALDKDDHVTLLTFDDGVRSTWQGPAPSRDVLLSKLPAEPTGQQTDIGAAIDAGVAALGRSGGRKVGAVILLTDGQLDASATSRYPTADAPAWSQLRARADKARAGRQVGAFALSLGPDTDAGLLTKVFPQSKVATPNDVSGYLAGVNRELTKLRVAEVLRPDLAKPVSVRVDGVTVVGTTLTATAHWTSSATKLPVAVGSVALSPSLTGAKVSIEPTSVALAPGASATSTITVTGLPPGQGTVALNAALTSPWQSRLTAAGLKLPGPVTSQAVDYVAQATPSPTPSAATTPAPTEVDAAPTSAAVALPGWALGVIAGLVALLALLVVVLRVVRARLPQLDGSLALLDEAGVRDEFVLAGPAMDARRGTMRIQARGRRDGLVDVRGKSGSTSFSGTLADGDTLTAADGLTLRYTAKRTRMLDMVSSD